MEAGRLSIFITYIRPEALDIHTGLTFASNQEKSRTDKALEFLNS